MYKILQAVNDWWRKKNYKSRKSPSWVLWFFIWHPSQTIIPSKIQEFSEKENRKDVGGKSYLDLRRKASPENGGATEVLDPQISEQICWGGLPYFSFSRYILCFDKTISWKSAAKTSSRLHNSNSDSMLAFSFGSPPPPQRGPFGVLLFHIYVLTFCWFDIVAYFMLLSKQIQSHKENSRCHENCQQLELLQS